MSPTTRYAKKQAKPRHRRRRTAQERLARDLHQAQQAAEALQQALDDLGLPNPSMWPQLSSSLEHFFLFLALLVRSELGGAHTGSVCACGDFSPYAPCDCLRLLCAVLSPLSH